MPTIISADLLAATVSGILNEYGDECMDVLEESVKTVAKEAANELKSAGKFKGSGKYRGGWKSKTERKRISVDGVVYNAAAPGLTHLLEFGHATVNGGRTRAFPHIADVNESAQNKLVEELERKL